jgi:hypothetical protein
MSGTYLQPQFQPFRSSGGICYPSKDYQNVTLKGGSRTGGNYSHDSLIPKSTGADHYKAPQFEKQLDADFFQKNEGNVYATAFGGAKKRKSKSTKKRSTSRRRKMRGGQITVEADLRSVLPTNVSMQIVPAEVPSGDNFSDESVGLSNGNGSKVFQFAEHKDNGMKAPHEKVFVYHTVMKGQDSGNMEIIGFDNLVNTIMSFFKRNNNKNSATVNVSTTPITPNQTVTNVNVAIPPTTQPMNVNVSIPTPPASTQTSIGGKKKRKTTKSKKTRKMRGGSTTGMPAKYYDANASSPSFSADSGKGMATAYGSANPKDVGVGLLAPYNANPNGNQSSLEKVGGRKKKLTGGSARVPRMSDGAVTGVKDIVNNTVNSLDSFMKNINQKFNQSVDKLENVKVGEQRLIHAGGAKKRKTKKSKKTTKKRRMRGGGGSDYALTLNSRGPVNYPDNGWYKGEQLFRQFNKTGDYIPNSQLAIAAAPQSTMSGIPKDGIVQGYDNLGQQWEPISKS